MEETDFWYRKEPILLRPGEVCKYIELCPFKKPDCFGANSNRKWDFVCDIKKLKDLQK